MIKADKEMIKAVKELRKLEEKQAELEAKIKEAEDALKGMIGDCEDDYDCGMWKMSWKTVVSKRLDTAAIKKAMPEIAEKFTKESASRRFSVR